MTTAINRKNYKSFLLVLASFPFYLGFTNLIGKTYSFLLSFNCFKMFRPNSNYPTHYSDSFEDNWLKYLFATIWVLFIIAIPSLWEMRKQFKKTEELREKNLNK